MIRTISITIIVCIMSLSVIISCSSNKQIEVKKDPLQLPTVSKIKYSSFLLPAWLTNLPEGNYVIGISPQKPDKRQNYSIAVKEFGELSMAYLKGSFGFDQEAILDYSINSDPINDFPEFKVYLKTHTSYADKVEFSLKPLAETSVEDNKLVIMGISEVILNNDLITVSASNIPKWCRGAKTFEEQGYIFSVANSNGEKLNAAWEQAQLSALNLLAQYRLQKLIFKLRNITEIEDRISLINNIDTNFNAVIAKSWFYHKLVDGKPNYTVFIMLKTDS